jgi:hypothetical protein
MDSGARASISIVTALPTDSQQEDPLDPERILRVLPDREHETFLAQYRQAVDGAHDPAGWKHLQRFLRLWAGRAIAASRPGFYEARDRALAGTGGGMLLDDAIRQYRRASELTGPGSTGRRCARWADFRPMLLMS